MPRRRVFFSFHYDIDIWRANQVRNMGVVEGNEPVSGNAWESVKKGGDAAIKRWIHEQMGRRTCAVVLIGSRTAGRKWIDYEIAKAWNDGLGVVGIHIHNLENSRGDQSPKGANPFARLTFNGGKASDVIKAYDPKYQRSNNVYAYIEANIADWVEEAIDTRKYY